MIVLSWVGSDLAGLITRAGSHTESLQDWNYWKNEFWMGTGRTAYSVKKEEEEEEEEEEEGLYLVE
jgi:hypothetical protein